MDFQGSLFDDTPPVPGLLLAAGALDAADEARIAALIDAAPLAPFRFGQWEGKRLTANYGSAYDYQRGRVTDAPPLPDWLVALRDRVVPLLGRDPDRFVQVLLIRYDPGAAIGWHRDRPQYEDVIGLSLSAPATLRLRRRTAGGFERAAIALPPRSLYLLSGEVRRTWEHSIAAQAETRRSVTFRSLRQAETGTP
ncbi:alpha-ketoglutarate-dependent dioxygenase AlkB [Parablastomonas sp. CN1-191]|uniref:alpha-ketoglutarate-dependent dioxygenase AlkB n=1 Tax=Parablastomonas sp. CN1-191 TaxID=3400908 RepID=UPI003BF8FE37